MSTTTMAPVMRIAVIGSRVYPQAGDIVLGRLRLYKADFFAEYRLHIVSGGAVGVDRAAEAAAKRLGLDYTVHQPEYKKYGPAATHIRNDLILDDSERVLAFWDFKSPGTASTLKKAYKRNLPIECYDLGGEPAGLKLRTLLDG